MITLCKIITKSIEKREFLNFDKKDLIRKRSSLFVFGTKAFYNLMSGEKGKEKKLLAYILLSYEEHFISSMVDHKTLKHQEGIEYLSQQQIEEIFDFRKGSITSWNSKSKAFLRKTLLNTPECFVYCYISFFMNEKSLMKLFPKS